MRDDKPLSPPAFFCWHLAYPAAIGWASYLLGFTALLQGVLFFLLSDLFIDFALWIVKRHKNENPSLLTVLLGIAFLLPTSVASLIAEFGGKLVAADSMFAFILLFYSQLALRAVLFVIVPLTLALVAPEDNTSYNSVD